MPARPSPHKIETDFLVVGSGVAGLRAAIELSRVGRVLMLTKGHPLESNSMYAQGGVAVALSEEDDVGSHLSDTLKAGHGLCRREAVRVLVEEGPERIQELISWGAKFDKIGKRFALRVKRRTAKAVFCALAATLPETRWCARSWLTRRGSHASSDWIVGSRSIWRSSTAGAAGLSC